MDEQPGDGVDEQRDRHIVGEVIRMHGETGGEGQEIKAASWEGLRTTLSKASNYAHFSDKRSA